MSNSPQIPATRKQHGGEKAVTHRNICEGSNEAMGSHVQNAGKEAFDKKTYADMAHDDGLPAETQLIRENAEVGSASSLGLGEIRESSFTHDAEPRPASESSLEEGEIRETVH